MTFDAVIMRMSRVPPASAVTAEDYINLFCSTVPPSRSLDETVHLTSVSTNGELHNNNNNYSTLLL